MNHKLKAIQAEIVEQFEAISYSVNDIKIYLADDLGNDNVFSNLEHNVFTLTAALKEMQDAVVALKAEVGIEDED